MDYENDIPRELAQIAHNGTSFVPEKRAEQERQSYAATLRQDFEALSKLATTDEKRATLEDEFARYRAGYGERFRAYLGARSRCISAMITGPARFPTARNAKRNETADRRSGELGEYRERALAAIRRTLCPELAPIMTGDANAGERLAAKIAAAESDRTVMKAANAEARRLKQPQPFPAYKLTNLGANIRRMKERVQIVAKAQATPDSSRQGTAARLEDCPAENRVRLFFPGKPDETVRTELKRRGFRWTPSLGCWQAYRNTWSLETAAKIAGA